MSMISLYKCVIGLTMKLHRIIITLSSLRERSGVAVECRQKNNHFHLSIIDLKREGKNF
jgi:hypothetical protein